MHGWVESYEVEPDGQHVIMTCNDPSEGQQVTVRVSRVELETMLRATPCSDPAPLRQTPTRHD